MVKATSISRRVLNSSGHIAVANGIARALTMLCFLQMSRWLGPAPIGIYSLASSLVGVGTTIGLQGLDVAYSRYISEPGRQELTKIEAFFMKRSIISGIISAAFKGI